MSAGLPVISTIRSGADPIGDLLALLAGPLIVPQQRRSDHLPVAIEEDGPVHLPGEADPDDLVRRRTARRGDAAQHLARGAPPLRRILLGPLRARRQQRVLGRASVDHCPALVDRDRAGTGGPHVDPDRGPHVEDAAFATLAFRTDPTEPRSTSSRMEHDRARRPLPALSQATEHEFGGAPRHVRGGLPDRGHRGLDHAHPFDIVERDDRDVAWYPESLLSERDEDRLSEDVVRGEDRRRRGARADQFRRVLDRVLPVERPGLDQRVADREAVRLRARAGSR